MYKNGRTLNRRLARIIGVALLFVAAGASSGETEQATQEIIDPEPLVFAVGDDLNSQRTAVIEQTAVKSLDIDAIGLGLGDVVDPGTMQNCQSLPAGTNGHMSTGCNAADSPLEVIKKTMSPETLARLYTLVSNPATRLQHLKRCAQCHEAGDLDRYEQALGPMMQLTREPTQWMNPAAYFNAMAPMMDMRTYVRWSSTYLNWFSAAMTSRSMCLAPAPRAY